MNCASADCSTDALFVVYWPGAERQPMCALCVVRAAGVAGHMGFTLPAEPLAGSVLETLMAERAARALGADLGKPFEDWDKG